MQVREIIEELQTKFEPTDEVKVEIDGDDSTDYVIESIEDRNVPYLIISE